MMITALYASILALLMCFLTINVVKYRRQHKVRYADGGVKELQIARTAHSNCVDTVPIFLILLFLLEYNGAYLWLIHLAGISFLTGRLIHARGILRDKLRGRILGMHITIWTIVSVIVLNLVYLPYDLIIP